MRRTDPGDPEVCNIYTMHRAFSPEDAVRELGEACKSASVGCIDCKRVLLKNMMAELTPIREKALSLKGHPDYIMDALKQGPGLQTNDGRRPWRRSRKVLGLLRLPHP